MIRKNVLVGKVKCDVVDFGFGSVSMQPAFLDDEKKPTLLMKTNDTEKEVGEESSEWHGKNSDDYKPEIALVFANEKSLDALIQTLEDCRSHFQHKVDA